MKKMYIGDIYKVTEFLSDYTKEKILENSGISALVCNDEVIIPESVTKFNDHYELYKSNVLMIKLDDTPLSDFVIIEENDSYIRLHSYPTKLNSLFVDINSISPYIGNKKVKTFKLVKAKLKK